MFDTTHDAVLLVFAGLYVLVTLARAIQVGGAHARPGYVPPRGVLTAPALIATALVLAAVFW